MSSFQELVDGHQGLVKKIALSISQRVRTQVPLDDMIGYGQLGLIQAARAYNEKSQAKFSTYAYYRISGAIYDGLWQMDWSSRAEHRKLKASQLANDLRDPQREELSEENAQDRLSGSTGTDDLAGELGWANRTIAGLAAIYFFSGLASEENAFDVESAGRDPQAETELKELKQKLRGLIDNLPPLEKELVELCYFRNLSISEGASRLGKSRSWGSKTHNSILEKLSKQFVEMEVST